MASTKKAALVTGRELNAAVDKAVAIAAKRHGAAISDTNLITNWELIGRILKERELADPFANDVAAALVKSGIPAQPATLRWGRQILCGFFERGRLPQVREFG